MSVLTDLLNQIQNEELKERIQEEIDKLTKQKKFGLVFEEHLPECTPLFDIPVKKGAKVALKTGQVNDYYTVLSISNGLATCIPANKKEPVELNINDLVCVAEFGDPIYPYLQPIDSICNAPDSDLWHTLIQADNYHALQLLEYLYAGKVDCIYIDPPYNTGARDWKYNNDYVDANDTYRHSKWLSMMQKRLRLAKKLLNPNCGVLVIAIDDNEVNTLGLLLNELFPSYKSFCITVIHNPNGNQGKNFGITNEFLYFLLPNNDQILSYENREEEPDIRPLRDVSGNNNLRTDAKNCFYPILVKNNQIIGFGDVCEDSFHPKSANILQENGIMEIYPIDVNGIEKKWVFARQTVESISTELKVEYNKSRCIYDIIRYKTHFTYKSVWSKKEYNANSYGSKLLNSILSDKRFNYPKSLYAVKEAISAVCKNKPNALILDFFAGSGTTLHAVNLLNAEDGGKRRCIMVTNNEVSDEETKSLRAKGINPGDKEWENLGIAKYVTWPRTVCSIQGKDINGNPLKGNYLSNDEPMANGFKANAAFFKLSFLDKTAIALGRQFKEMLPTLWLKAGSFGKCPELLNDEIPSMMILPENKFAILVDEKSFSDFKQKLQDYPEIQTTFIITDYEKGFLSMTETLGMKTYQLYRDYLDNFRINTERN